jgi:hypothetical protein
MFMLNNSRNSKLTIVASIVITVIAISTLAVAPFSANSPASLAGANDFYQRHPDWRWASNMEATGMTIDMMRYRTKNQNLSSAAKPIDLSDYYLRHPELRVPVVAEFSAEQIQREYVLGERYGGTPHSEAREKVLREYWLGERYGQRP